MLPIEGRSVLSVEAVRAAERDAIAGGVDAAALMARAGDAIARAAQRLAAGSEVLILCGPGNNGGDGYLAATGLRRAGHAVRVATALPPASDGARAAAVAWGQTTDTIDDANPAPVVIDAVFGIGLSRPLDAPLAAALRRHVEAARLAIAADVPSGVAADSGALLNPVARFALTLALGAVKPAHLLQPAADRCGAVRLVDIGLAVSRAVAVLAPVALPEPGPDDHKYSRGYVAVVGGAMAGAALLAATAAQRSGAGYVALLGDAGAGGPHALVHREFAEAIGDGRIGALVVGPGLGRDARARALLEAAIDSAHPLVIDGDALHLLDLDRLHARSAPAVLTPHAGEFAQAFGSDGADKIARTRSAAERADAVVVFKGADTVIAAPDGRVRITPPQSARLATAGSGDVLAGIVGTALAQLRDPFEAACAGVAIHGAAARRFGGTFIADDLVEALRR